MICDHLILFKKTINLLLQIKGYKSEEAKSRLFGTFFTQKHNDLIKGWSNLLYQ